MKTVYSAEISTPRLRGRLTVLTSLAIAVGILMIYILGYIFPVLAHTIAVVFLIDFHFKFYEFKDDWRIVSGISAVFCMFTLFLVYFIPESPAWLISRGRSDDARKALAHIRAIKYDSNGTFVSCFSYFPINFHANASLQNYSRVNH